MIPVDFQSIHHFSTAGLAGMMNQAIYLWEYKSGLSLVVSYVHSMLGE